MKKQLLLSLLIFFILSHANAYTTVPDIITDSMVLQQNVRVPVWGNALPGESVTVAFNHQVKTTKAGDDGKWMIYLDPMHADEIPQTMVITGINTIRLKGILIGEVWLCSGQSNMQLTLSLTNKGDSVIASANYPLVRLFNISRDIAFHHHHGAIGVWQNCTPSSVKEFSAAAYYFAVALQQKLNVPVGIINSSFGGSQAEAWIPESYLHSSDLQPCVDRGKMWIAERAKVQKEYASTIQEWKIYAAKERAAGRIPKEAPHQPEALREYRPAASIYENMIRPLLPFAIRGNIWYQGENNEDRAEQYGVLLPTLIRAWREKWNEADFPFGIVQLPNFRDAKSDPADEAWSHLRDAQRWTSDTVANTGLIVTIDIGEAHNIHYKDKLDVGKRMCRWALSDVYHQQTLPGGPVFEKAETSGKRMIVTFKVTGSGLTTTDGKAPQEFALAGADHQWHWAKAKIINKNQMVVWSTEVRKPLAVRYAFNDNPKDPNLTNDSKIPASPFRSDNWPGPTHGKR
jgi:sialate O-acetylesterase